MMRKFSEKRTIEQIHGFSNNTDYLTFQQNIYHIAFYTE